MKWSELVVNEGVDGPLCLKLQRETIDPHIVARFTVDAEPASKARARYSNINGKHYSPDSNRVAEDRVAWAFRQVGGGRGAPDATNNFGVFIGFFCESGHRRDLDNMVKLVLDALNGIAWADDMQVTEISAKLQRWQADPRTEVVVYYTLLQNHPTKPCEQCGKPFFYYPSQTGKRQRHFCNAACWYEWRRDKNHRTCQKCERSFQSATPAKFCSKTCADESKRVDVPCAQCGTPVSRPQCFAEKNAYCGDACKHKFWHVRRTAAAKGTCGICGGATSKKTYRRCNHCRLAGDNSKTAAPMSGVE